MVSVTDKIKKFNDKLGWGFKPNGDNGNIPFFPSGARCFIKMAGEPIAYCQDFRWSVAYSATPIMTVDSIFPWDIDVGPVNIQATLTKIMDPTKGPEAEGLFPIMSAAVHQPMVELQVIYKAVQNTGKAPDKSNTVEMNMFFARGMFTSVSGNATVGQVSNLTASFTGVAYQHYVSQQFKPYGAAYAMQETMSAAKEAVSALTGGFL
jgi:hypothetical protein